VEMSYAFAAGVIVTIVLLAGAIPFYDWLFHHRSKNLTVAAIETAVIPLAYRAILAAEKAAKYSAEQLGVQMHGIDKAAIAKAAYGYLPAYVPIGEFMLPVRALVSQERFVELVQRCFTCFDAWYAEHCQELEGLADQWAAEHRPPAEVAAPVSVEAPATIAAAPATDPPAAPPILPDPATQGTA
jgi:hypothetical protein